MRFKDFCNLLCDFDDVVLVVEPPVSIGQLEPLRFVRRRRRVLAIFFGEGDAHHLPEFDLVLALPTFSGSFIDCVSMQISDGDPLFMKIKDRYTAGLRGPRKLVSDPPAAINQFVKFVFLLLVEKREEVRDKLSTIEGYRSKHSTYRVGFFVSLFKHSNVAQNAPILEALSSWLKFRGSQ